MKLACSHCGREEERSHRRAVICCYDCKTRRWEAYARNRGNLEEARRIFEEGSNKLKKRYSIMQ